MISPSEYDKLCDQLITLYDDLDNAIISDITRRILKTGRITESAEWQIKQLQESGMLYDDILAEIASRTNATENQVRTLFEDAGVQSIRNDNRYYRAAGLEGIVKMSDAALQTLNAGYLKCSGDLRNLTLTTAVTSQQAYITACNNAYMQVTSGAFDYNTAIRNAIKSAAVEGTHVLYPTGHKDRIDVAVRRAVLTGVGQTVREVSRINAVDMDCDIMEITAHSGARLSHAVWQGQLVSLSGKNAGKIIEGCRVLSLKEIGYGSGDGFGGWNCRHDWYPFFEGISHRAYSDERLKQLDEKNIEYNGRKYSEYEISQIQRRYEREIRFAKREQVAFKTAVQEAKDPELKQVMQDSLNYANSALKNKQAKMRDFIKQTGQFRDYSREQNYGRVTYSKNSGETLTNPLKNAKIRIEEGKVSAYLESKPKLDSKISNDIILALSGTNPKYWTGDVGYQKNCQRCVAAYEARRRGYNVTAKSASAGHEAIKNMTGEKGWANVYQGGEDAIEIIFGSTGIENKENICRLMSGYGNGSRAIVRVRFNENSGHVFIAEQVGEQTRFLDPQDGSVDITEIFSSIKPNMTRLLRIDDKEFTELIKECVE